MSATPASGDALLIVDPQVDFCPGGALGVPNGDTIFGPLSDIASAFATVVVSRDWHPPDHVSFRARGGPWPVHCVAGTPGAEFHPSLHVERIDHVVSKATDRDEEAYSAFHGTDLAAWLKERGVKRVFIGGLATDYCVVNSTLDAIAGGFEVVVLEDCVGAVDVTPGDGDRALARMREAGAEMSQIGRAHV